MAGAVRPPRAGAVKDDDRRHLMRDLLHIAEETRQFKPSPGTSASSPNEGANLATT